MLIRASMSFSALCILFFYLKIVSYLIEVVSFTPFVLLRTTLMVSVHMEFCQSSTPFFFFLSLHLSYENSNLSIVVSCSKVPIPYEQLSNQAQIEHSLLHYLEISRWLFASITNSSIPITISTEHSIYTRFELDSMSITHTSQAILPSHSIPSTDKLKPLNHSTCLAGQRHRPTQRNTRATVSISAPNAVSTSVTRATGTVATVNRTECIRNGQSNDNGQRFDHNNSEKVQLGSDRTLQQCRREGSRFGEQQPNCGKCKLLQQTVTIGRQ